MRQFLTLIYEGSFISTHARYSKKLTFLILWYANQWTGFYMIGISIEETIHCNISDATGIYTYVTWKKLYIIINLKFVSLSKVARSYFSKGVYVKRVRMNNFLNTATSLLLFSLTICARLSKLKTYKNVNQFNIRHNITQIGNINMD